MLSIKENLQKSDILKLFACKSEQTVGVEYERLPISNSTLKAVDYDEGICDFLRQFAKEENWDYITDDYNIIGLKQNHDTITLEPGCQVELSLKPENSLQDLEKKIKTLNKTINDILSKTDIKLLNYGVSPLSTHKSINIIPKKRYKIMARYLWGILSDVMMRETAGIQGCFDFSSQEDASRKFAIANKLTPFVTAMFANSPIRGGVETGYKTFRALSWLNTDNDRCGYALNLNYDFTFEKYVDAVLNSPIIYLKKDEKYIVLNGKINFEEYLKNGYENFYATMEDFELHANLYFPEVRVRNFLEIRNQDCNHMPLSVLALYKGILYDNTAMCDVENLLKPYNFKDFTELRYNVPKNTLNSFIGKNLAGDIAKEILIIAENSLKNTNEQNYLEPIKELTMQGLCPADIILKNWNGCWNKNVRKLVDYLIKLS